MKIDHVIKRIRIDRAARFRLADYDTAQTHGIDCDKDAARQHLAADVERLRDLQVRLYAARRWAVLVVLQGMDASGKDGIVKHVMSGINPQGCDVHAFKQPTDEELDHDFLWRCARVLPARGRIGIFNRSYYEEVLIARVQPESLAQQKLPKQLVTPRIWQERFEAIRAFERTLAHNGTLVLKFFLHISKEEQRERPLASGRIERVDHDVFPDAVQAARHQVVHQVVTRGDAVKYRVHKVLLVLQRHVAVAEMGGLVGPIHHAFTLNLNRTIARPAQWGYHVTSIR